MPSKTLLNKHFKVKPPNLIYVNGCFYQVQGKTQFLHLQRRCSKQTRIVNIWFGRQRQTDEQTNRQTDKQTNRQTDQRDWDYCIGWCYLISCVSLSPPFFGNEQIVFHASTGLPFVTRNNLQQNFHSTSIKRKNEKSWKLWKWKDFCSPLTHFIRLKYFWNAFIFCWLHLPIFQLTPGAKFSSVNLLFDNKV